MNKVIPADTLQDHIGHEVGITDWLTIEQERIDQFADATDDHQYIHVDAERASQTPFRGTIAHGFLTLSLLSALSPIALSTKRRRSGGSSPSRRKADLAALLPENRPTSRSVKRMVFS